MIKIILDSSLQEQNQPFSRDLRYYLSSIAYRHFMPGMPLDCKPVESIMTSNLHNCGLIGLLSKAYAQHLKVALSPHDIWILLISELMTELRQHPEILVQVEQQQGLIHFSPEFSTSPAIVHEMMEAMQQNIAMASYEETVFSCGIPVIALCGEHQDWFKLRHQWKTLQSLMKADEKVQQYFKRTLEIIENIEKTFIAFNKQQQFWRDIFVQNTKNEGCDYEINGWITRLLMNNNENGVSSLNQIHNCHGIMEYDNAQKDHKYIAIYGGFNAQEDEQGFLHLSYGKYIFQVK